MKNRLVKNWVGAKIVCSHLDAMAMCSMVENSGTLELFEKFMPNDGTLNNIKN